MENVDQLFNASGYHAYSHPQQQLQYQFFPPQQQQQHALSRQPSPRPHPSPAPASIPASPHPLFVQQQQQSQLAHEAPGNTQDHRDPEVPIDQIQEDAPIDEEPLYVNAKQYYRILKRRVARARLEEVHRLSRQRKPYLHESRHKHAMRRPRGPGGRFLTSEEIAAQKAAQALDAGPSASTSQDGEEDEDIDHADNGVDADMDAEMAVASPIDERKPVPQQLEQSIQRPNLALQSNLQPRPQLQIPATAQQQQQQRLLQSQGLLPSQSPHHQPQSAFDHPMSMGHTDLLTAYHAGSQPPTPAPVSPHGSMTDLMQQRSQERGKHDHSGHGHHGHTHHGHHRHLVSSISQASATQTGTTSQPTAPVAGSNTNIAMRGQYTSMQMHHVPHPHAHARHHHSYINRAEQLYASTGQGVNIP